MVQLHHSLLQLTCLVGREAEVADVVGAVFLRLVVSQLGLDGVGAKKGVSDEWAGQATGQDVVPQLQAQVVPEETREVEMLLTLHFKALGTAMPVCLHVHHTGTDRNISTAIGWKREWLWRSPLSFKAPPDYC